MINYGYYSPKNILGLKSYKVGRFFESKRLRSELEIQKLVIKMKNKKMKSNICTIREPGTQTNKENQ